jgi:hypothetical protein
MGRRERPKNARKPQRTAIDQMDYLDLRPEPQRREEYA